MRIIFMGTPDFAVPALKGLLEAGHDIIAVYSQPPRQAGRGMKLRPSPVQGFADEQGLPVRTPESLKSQEDQEYFASLAADAAVVIAYGLILPGVILDMPRFGCFNVHASLLPRWRGAAPIQRAIMEGDPETGTTIMRMDEGLDTGDICLQAELSISSDLTAGQLHDALAGQGASLIVEALARAEAGALDCTPQPQEGVTYAAKISSADGRVDWSKPAAGIHNQIRGLSPYPGAWCEFVRDGKVERLKLLRSEMAEGSGSPGTLIAEPLVVACGQAAIRLVEVQRAGKRPMAAAELLRGVPLAPGTKLL